MRSPQSTTNYDVTIAYIKRMHEASKQDPRYEKYEAAKTELFNKRDAELVTLRAKARNPNGYPIDG